MNKFFITVFFLLTGIFAKSQSCTVDFESLKGTYEGDCKKGKAHGKGTATGTDSYTGEFKNGFPEGFGKYVWKNGDWYEGSFKKGIMEGQGTFHNADKKQKDSVQTGFWKKGNYVGLYEKPYVVHSKTPSFSTVRMDNTKGPLNEVSINCQSVTGGALSVGGPIPKPVITNIDIVNGQYQIKTDYDNLPKSALTTFRGVVFPLRLRLSYGSDLIDFEIFEAGNWSVELKILK